MPMIHHQNLTEQQRLAMLEQLATMIRQVEQSAQFLKAQLQGEIFPLRPVRMPETALATLLRIWDVLPEQTQTEFCIEHLTPRQRRQICLGLDDEEP